MYKTLFPSSRAISYAYNFVPGLNNIFFPLSCKQKRIIKSSPFVKLTILTYSGSPSARRCLICLLYRLLMLVDFAVIAYDLIN
ncbi:MAG: hypothetical protein AABX16_03070, partial [Nanoarchaeota archaeon]